MTHWFMGGFRKHGLIAETVRKNQDFCKRRVYHTQHLEKTWIFGINTYKCYLYTVDFCSNPFSVLIKNHVIVAKIWKQLEKINCLK